MLLSPALGTMVMFYLYPLTRSVYRSFVDNKGLLTTKNYETAISIYGVDILYTLGISLMSLLVVGLGSILLASYLRFEEGDEGTTLRFDLGRVLARLLHQIYRFPLFIPFLVVGHAMRTFLAPHGLLNLLLAYFHLIDIDYPPKIAFTWKGLVLSFLWKQLPFATLLILGGFKSIENAYVESARNLSAGKLRITWDILIPMTLPTISVAMVLTFMTTMSTLTLPLMMGSDNPVMITVDMAFRITYFGDYGTANALGVISYLLVGGVSLYYLRYIVRQEER
jgi:ABC-type sugar transport system permease subunit